MVVTDYLKDKILWRIVDGETAQLLRMLIELMWLGADWAERRDGQKVDSRERWNLW